MRSLERRKKPTTTSTDSSKQSTSHYYCFESCKRRRRSGCDLSHEHINDVISERGDDAEEAGKLEKKKIFENDRPVSGFCPFMAISQYFGAITAA